MERRSKPFVVPGVVFACALCRRRVLAVFPSFWGVFTLLIVKQRVDVRITQQNKIKAPRNHKHNSIPTNTPQMIKRLCRKLGMPRWPYRQIDSINKAMEDLHDQLEGARNEADRARYNMCLFFFVFCVCCFSLFLCFCGVDKGRTHK